MLTSLINRSKLIMLWPLGPHSIVKNLTSLIWSWTETKPVFLPPANEVCEGYVFTGVCLSTGGSRSLSRGVSIPGGESLSRGVWGGSVRKTPLYGNERAVRILLECILVTNEFNYKFSTWKPTIVPLGVSVSGREVLERVETSRSTFHLGCNWWRRSLQQVIHKPHPGSVLAGQTLSTLHPT